MPWYRIGAPGEDGAMHIRFGRKKAPLGCRAERFPNDKPDWGESCGRVASAACDAPAGVDVDGTPLTCSKAICDLHRTTKGDLDYCPTHRELAEKTS